MLAQPYIYTVLGMCGASTVGESYQCSPACKCSMKAKTSKIKDIKSAFCGFFKPCFESLHFFHMFMSKLFFIFSKTL